MGAPLLFDVAHRRWSDEMLDALELPKEWLPPVHESPEVVGLLDAVEDVGAAPVGRGPAPDDEALAAQGHEPVEVHAPVGLALGHVVARGLDRRRAFGRRDP